MAARYCTKCGYANSERSGACLMCYAYLDAEPGGGAVCSNSECGLQSDRHAAFCVHCGTAIAEEVEAIPAALTIAFAVLNAAEGTTGTADTIGPAVATEEPQMDQEQAAAFEEFKAQQTDLGDQEQEEAPFDADRDEEDEEYAPPSALTLEQQAMGAAEPSEELEEDLVPPPPPEEEPALAMGDLSMGPDEPAEAPVAPSAAEEQPLPAELSEEDFAPPVPEDLPGFDEDVEAPPQDDRQPAAAEPPEAAQVETEPEKQEDAPSEDDELGGWSLDFDDEEDKE